jgi:hypothetical protein
MTVDQMLWHVNAGFDNALGRLETTPVRLPVPRAIARFFAFHAPWPKGRVETQRELLASGSHDFTAEQARALQLIDEFAERPEGGAWPTSAALGLMRGCDWSRLMAKHLDHHLRQFGC